MKILGQGLSIPEFEAYLRTVSWDSWSPSLVVVHHTAAPSLAQRPRGVLQEHMANLKAFYEGKGWSAGPHLFIDEDQVWLFSPLSARGVHAVSFNRSGIGIEMLGNYDVEDPWSGRGLEVLTTTAKAVALLLEKLGAGPEAVKFHRDDPTTSKTCPGEKISKAKFLAHVQLYAQKTTQPQAPGPAGPV